MIGLLATMVALLKLVHASPPDDCYFKMADFRPESNVTQHSRIDLDVQEIDSLSDAGDFTGVQSIYANGKNSIKSGALRKIRDFSLNAPTLMTGQTYYEIYQEYWGNTGTYADEFVQAAMGNGGTGQFANMFDNAAQIVRSECVTKGIQYQVVWMYVVRELEDAVDDCEAASQNRNADGVKAVDEAWAFYAGSLEGVDGTSDGYLLYTLADKRCGQFGVCDDANAANPRSKINLKLVAEFEKMQALLRLGQCSDAAAQIGVIVPLMTVPLIQGTYRYMYRGNAPFSSSTDFAKERAEGWAFAAALLPQLAKCDANAASTLRDQMIWNADPYVSNGIAANAKLIQDNLACMNIKCADIGTYSESGEAEAVIPQCTDQSATPSATCFHEDSVIEYNGEKFTLAEIEAGAQSECTIPHKFQAKGVKVVAECPNGEVKKLRLTGDHLVYSTAGLKAANELVPGDALYTNLGETEECHVSVVVDEPQTETYFGLNCLNSIVLADGFKTSTFEKMHALPASWMNLAGNVMGIKAASVIGEKVANVFTEAGMV